MELINGEVHFTREEAALLEPLPNPYPVPNEVIARALVGLVRDRYGSAEAAAQDAQESEGCLPCTDTTLMRVRLDDVAGRLAAMTAAAMTIADKVAQP